MENKAIDKVLEIVRARLHEDGAPTNSVSGGHIAGTAEAGDDPPVRKKKRYIYQKGVRKLWMTKNGGAS